jgi:predicted dehydrogenase
LSDRKDRLVINAALVGLGWWGRTIAGTLAQSSLLRIAAATDIDPAAATTAASLGVPFAQNLEKILADPAIQAVILCTPHSLHAGQIKAVAAAGKHVFCEKPLCLTRADAAAAIEACRRAGVILGLGHERRFEPPVLELRRLVAAGELGTPLQIEANFSQDKFLSLPADNWRLSAADAPAGPMTATGIHLLDLSVSLLGPARRVLASVRRLGSNLANGDTLAALVEFESGASALLSAILATPFDGRFSLYGSKGWAEVRDKAHPEKPEGWTFTTVLRNGGKRTAEYPPAPSVRANLEAFAAAASGGPAYPITPSEMLATVAALEAVVRSASTGKVENVAGV